MNWCELNKISARPERARRGWACFAPSSRRKKNQHWGWNVKFFSLLSKDLSQSTAENEIFHLSFDSASTHSLLLACFTLLTVHIESMNNQYLRWKKATKDAKKSGFTSNNVPVLGFRWPCTVSQLNFHASTRSCMEFHCEIYISSQYFHTEFDVGWRSETANTTKKPEKCCSTYWVGVSFTTWLVHGHVTSRRSAESNYRAEQDYGF